MGIENNNKKIKKKIKNKMNPATYECKKSSTGESWAEAYLLWNLLQYHNSKA